jgi:hypothetical protein
VQSMSHGTCSRNDPGNASMMKNIRIALKLLYTDFVFCETPVFQKAKSGE